MVQAVIAHSALLDTSRALDGGMLIGCVDGSELIALSAVPCSPADFESSKGSIEALLPPPLAIIGTFAPSAPASRSFSWQRLVLDSSSGEAHVAAGSGGLQAVDPVTEAADAADLLASRFVPVRLAADHVLEVASSSGQAAAFAALEQRLCGSGSLYVIGPSSGGGGGNLAAQQQGQAELQLPGSQSFAEMGGSWERPVTLHPFLKGSSSGSSHSGGGFRAAIATLAPAAGGETLQRSALHIDVLVYAPKRQAAEDAVSQLVRPAVARQLAAMRAEAAGAGALPPLSAFHLAPAQLGGLHLTLVYPLPTKPSEAAEAALAGRRAWLHQLLGLPPNRPLLRAAFAVDLAAAAAAAAPVPAAAAAAGGAAGSAGSGSGGRLSDVHVGLPPSGVGGSVHIVQGSYQYFHYMQDRFDDNGWGCAYRSFQTIWSWYAAQRLIPPGPHPGHRDIQRELVAASQRPPSFLGSREWIGALELGCLVERLLLGGAEGGYRVLNVGSGSDIPSLAREIAHHFDTHGSPIMIGGGVLAYTLLGIDFDERTGECAFLILDPHYTCADDLKKIRAGGWVAWRRLGDKSAGGSELFRADSFYNFMCPLPPAGV